MDLHSKVGKAAVGLAWKIGGSAKEGQIGPAIQ